METGIPVVFDGYCGEPVGWCREGAPVIGREWGGFGNNPIPYSSTLGAAEAIEKYGPMTSMELGPRGGFRSVTYGSTKFISRLADPRVSL